MAGQLHCRVQWETLSTRQKAVADREMDGHALNKTKAIHREEMDALLEEEMCVCV